MTVPLGPARLKTTVAEARELAGRVHVEPLGRALLAGVPVLADALAGGVVESGGAESGGLASGGVESGGLASAGVESDRSAADGSVEPARRRSLDVGIVPVFSDERPLTGLAGFFDWRVSGGLSALLRTRWWSGAAGQSMLMPARRNLPVRRIVLFGLGDSARFDDTQARLAATAMVVLAQRLTPRDVMFAMPGKGQERAIVETVFEAALGAMGQRVRHEGPPASADLPQDPCAWWVIADPRHVARLRRVLAGPPSAAQGSG